MSSPSGETNEDESAGNRRKPTPVSIENLVHEKRWEDVKQRLKRVRSPKRLGTLLRDLEDQSDVPLDFYRALFSRFDCFKSHNSKPHFEYVLSAYLNQDEVYSIVERLDWDAFQLLLDQYGSQQKTETYICTTIYTLWYQSIERSSYKTNGDIEAALSSIHSAEDLALPSNKFWLSLWNKTIGLYRLSLPPGNRQDPLETLPFVNDLVRLRYPKGIVWLALRLYPSLAKVMDVEKIPLHWAIDDHQNSVNNIPSRRHPNYARIVASRQLHIPANRSMIEILLEVWPDGAKSRDANGKNTLDILLEDAYTREAPYRDAFVKDFQKDIMTLVTCAPEILSQVNPTHQILPFMLAASLQTFPAQYSGLWHQKLNFTYMLLRKDPSVLRLLVCADPASRQNYDLQKQLQEAQDTIKKQQQEIAELKAATTTLPRKERKTNSHGSLPPGPGALLIICLLLGLSTFAVEPAAAFRLPVQHAIKHVPSHLPTSTATFTRQASTIARVSVALDSVQTSASFPRRFDPRKLPRTTYKAKVVGKHKKNGKDPAEVEAAVNAGLDALGGLSDSLSTPSFPSVRECNSALSAFGDQGDLLRSLRMFGKMRKAAYLQRLIQRQTGVDVSVPVPTLVTYSTLMSRAVRAGKPHVALRLWKMKPSSLEPDVKSINILVNCYAKLGNAPMAKTILNEMEPEPNLVTFNTVLKACQKAGDLDGALEIKSLMQELSVRPDVWTYTTLLATVGLGKSRSSGERDPTIALHLLQEMHKWDVYPNGMTYSAFIEACGRCGRVDLALQGLRTMQRQKDRDKERRGLDSFHLSDEVGAWTSAINVCGKAGRWETAVKLFSSMKKLGCAPNTVTCGCLADSLLRCGRTAETLGVLRYMKKEGILPTEVMYTSLMTRADRLIQMENKFAHDQSDVAEESGATAIEVYTELMMSLMELGEKEKDRRSVKYSGYENDSNTRLLKVFLVFQQMKAAGAEPDLACFNVLLRACASAGDVARGWNVLRQIQCSPRLEPNDRSWRELLRAAATAGDANAAETVWKYGLSHHLQHPRFIDEPERLWNPSIKSLQNLLVSYLRQADIEENVETRRDLYERVVQTYDGVVMGERHMGLQRLDPMEMLDDRRTILIVLRAMLSLRPLVGAARLAELQDTGRSLLQLDCLHNQPPLNPSAKKLVQSMRTWTSLKV